MSTIHFQVLLKRQYSVPSCPGLAKGRAKGRSDIRKDLAFAGVKGG